MYEVSDAVSAIQDSLSSYISYPTLMSEYSKWELSVKPTDVASLA